jgi:hypothetical protein
VCKFWGRGAAGSGLLVLPVSMSPPYRVEEGRSAVTVVVTEPRSFPDSSCYVSEPSHVNHVNRLPFQRRRGASALPILVQVGLPPCLHLGLLLHLFLYRFDLGLESFPRPQHFAL